MSGEESEFEMNINSFQLNTKIFFGQGILKVLAEEGKVFGKRVLIVSGKTFLKESGIAQQLESILEKAGVSFFWFDGVAPEPTLEMVNEGLIIARNNQVDWVIGIGGGSVMDVAKVIAGLYSATEPIDYYFAGGQIEAQELPLITIPTTAGSGAEVTFNAVITDPKTNLKKSIRDPKMTARITIVDPELTLHLPERITIYSGMDAFVQAIEAYTSKYANPLTDIYAYAAIEKIGNNLWKVQQNPNDINVRNEMAMGSLMAGIALSNARLGAVHGLAHAVGAASGKPHGLVCAVLLVPVMRFNLSVCYEKYAKIARALGNNIAVGDLIDEAAFAIKMIMILEKKLKLPQHIYELGIKDEDFTNIVKASEFSGSLRANPRNTSQEDLINILKENF